MKVCMHLVVKLREKREQNAQALAMGTPQALYQGSTNITCSTHTLFPQPQPQESNIIYLEIV